VTRERAPLTLQRVRELRTTLELGFELGPLDREDLDEALQLVQASLEEREPARQVIEGAGG
jgi:hypothetical protein